MTALLYVGGWGGWNAHMTGCERFTKAVYTPNKVLPHDHNGPKISRGGRRGREVTEGERLGCRYKVTPTHLRERPALREADLAWMNLNVFITGGIAISQTLRGLF